MEPDRPRDTLLARITAWLAPLRMEERVLFATWALGIALCGFTGIDSQSYLPVFKQYLYFFALYLVYLFVATRLLLYADVRWQPRANALVRAKTWLFGHQGDYRPTRLDLLVAGPLNGPGPRASVLALDLEFLRLALLLFANLTVYSNIKLHIPFINGTHGDEVFQQIDFALFGESFIRSIEEWFASNPGVAEYFADIYMHDYIWMVVLAFILYLRRDVFALRWTVISVCFVYIIGILMTVAYPSYGPCFIEPERFQWLDGSIVGRVQGSLAFTFRRNMEVVNNSGAFEARAFLGIAAFPSLHVAHMVIMGVVALRTIPIYALWMLWVTIATFIATIGFGWHYAVDGVGGILLAVVVTEGVYRLLRRWDRRAALAREAPV
jgi:hypothetical protein